MSLNLSSRYYSKICIFQQFYSKFKKIIVYSDIKLKFLIYIDYGVFFKLSYNVYDLYYFDCKLYENRSNKIYLISFELKNIKISNK